MSRTDEVIDGIRAMILEGSLRPGDRLPVEKDLAAELNVSRGSLREGIRALSLLGIVETRQGDGTYVTTLDAQVLLGPMGLAVDLQGGQNARHVHAVRRVLETESAGLAALHTTQEHLAEAEAAVAETEQVLAAGEIDHDRMLAADIAFHRALAAGSGNPVLAAFIEAMAGRTARGRLWRALCQEGAELRTHAEHREILAAVRAGDPDRARARMAVHLLGVEDFLSPPDDRYSSDL